MTDILVVIDMQNDFIDGALANPAAQKIVPGIAELVRSWNGPVVFTQDTHPFTYLATQEGKNLPVEHCIRGTPGWLIEDTIMDAARKVQLDHATWENVIRFYEKPTFGSWDMVRGLAEVHFDSKDTRITLVGTCTDICVISNAMLLKAKFLKAQIRVRADLCAGTTEENHRNALNAMKICQIGVIEE